MNYESKLYAVVRFDNLLLESVNPINLKRKLWKYSYLIQLFMYHSRHVFLIHCQNFVYFNNAQLSIWGLKVFKTEESNLVAANKKDLRGGGGCKPFLRDKHRNGMGWGFWVGFFLFSFTFEKNVLTLRSI